MTTDKQEAVQIAVELYQTWQANASRHGGNIHLLMQRVWDAWQPAAAADKPRHDGEWVSVPRTYLRLVHDTLQDIDAYIIVPTFARDDWETAKEQTAALAASPATSALGTEEGEHAADLAAFGASEHACYLYPGVDQQKERAAFCKGAAINATSHTQTIEALRAALKEAIKLQAHYAKLLNMHDGGERIPFESADQFLERLHALKEHTNG